MLKNNPVMFAQLVLKIIAQCRVLFLHTLAVEILAIFFEKITQLLSFPIQQKTLRNLEITY